MKTMVKKYPARLLYTALFIVALLIALAVLSFYMFSYLDFFEIQSVERWYYVAIQTFLSLNFLIAGAILYMVGLKRNAKLFVNKIYLLTILWALPATLGSALVHLDLLYSTHALYLSCTFLALYVIIFNVLYRTLIWFWKNLETKLSDQIELKGRLKHDVLIISGIKSLYYIQSVENYCDIYYIEENQLHKKVFRASIKELAEQLNPMYYMRVHKSYILNLNYVQNISGNVNNAMVIMSHDNVKIPIARSKRNEVLKRMTKISNRQIVHSKNVATIGKSSTQTLSHETV
ncbi:MAG: LytTR family DNA-binding domain-containing protein [Bacteroidota bacterium]